MNPIAVAIIYGVALLGAPIVFYVYWRRTKNSSSGVPSIRLENTGKPIDGGTKYIKIICR